MRRLGMLVAVLGVLLVGCSAGRSADDWAAAVCDALAPWRESITDLNRRTAEQMDRTTTTEETRRTLLALLSDARDATEAARARVVAAGVPDVDGGTGIAEGFTASLARTRDAYAAAEQELRALTADDEAAFYDGVVEVLDRLNQRYREAGIDLAALDSPQLRAAFERVSQCR